MQIEIKVYRKYICNGKRCSIFIFNLLKFIYFGYICRLCVCVCVNLCLCMNLHLSTNMHAPFFGVSFYVIFEVCFWPNRFASNNNNFDDVCCI